MSGWKTSWRKARSKERWKKSPIILNMFRSFCSAKHTWNFQSWYCHLILILHNKYLLVSKLTHETQKHDLQLLFQGKFQVVTFSGNKGNITIQTKGYFYSLRAFICRDNECFFKFKNILVPAQNYCISRTEFSNQDNPSWYSTIEGLNKLSSIRCKHIVRLQHLSGMKDVTFCLIKT